MITVNQLLQAIQHSGLSGDDEIVVRNISGDVIPANIEIGHNSESFLLRVKEMDEFDVEDCMDIDCYCGEQNCHYCGG